MVTYDGDVVRRIYVTDTITAGNMTVNGTFTFGDAAVDALILNGRLSTVSGGGSDITLNAAYTALYAEGAKLRYSITGWSAQTDMKGMYLRIQNAVSGSGCGLTGGYFIAVTNAGYSIDTLHGLYAEVGMKANGTQTVKNAIGVEGSLAPYGGTGAITITNYWAAFLATPSGVSSRIDASNAAKIHGVYVLCRDGDGGSTKLGSGIEFINDAAQAGTRTLTDGVKIGIGCTTGVNIAGATTSAITISGTTTTGIALSGTKTTGIDISGTTTRGIRVGTHDWGVGLTGIVLSTTDPLVQIAGRIAASNSTAGVYNCEYKQLALTSATQNTDTSWFADWNELYITPTTTTNLTGSSHYAAVKAHVECSGTITSSTGVTASLWGSNIIPAGYTNNGTIAGCYVDGIIHTSMTNTGDTMAYGIGAHNDPNQGDWEYAFYCPANTAVNGIAMNNTTGIGINSITSALTAGDTYSGIRASVTCPAANNAYGTAGYFDTLITGTVGGTFVYGLGSWINAGTITAAGRYICAQDNGLYIETGSTLTASKMIFGLRMECLIGAPNSGITHSELVFPFSINTQNNGITALFECMTATDLGVVAGAGADTTTLCPLFRDAGGNMRYVKLYS